MHIAIPKSTLDYIKQTRSEGGLNLKDNFNSLDQLLQVKILLANSLIESENKKLGLEEKDFFNAEEGQTAGIIKEKFQKYLESKQDELEKEQASLKELGWTEIGSRFLDREEEEIKEIKELREEVVWFEKMYWTNVGRNGNLDFQKIKKNKRNYRGGWNQVRRRGSDKGLEKWFRGFSNFSGRKNFEHDSRGVRKKNRKT